MFSNRIRFDVPFGDCDPIGIVYYPNYFRWFDHGFTALMKAADLAPATVMTRYNARFPLVDVGAKFFGPLKPEDPVTLETAVVEIAGKTIRFGHKIYLGESLRLEGHELRVWTIQNGDDPQGLKAAPVPDDVRAVLSAGADEKGAG